MSSLHRKLDDGSQKGLPPLYLFFDPTRSGEADDDSYVFSTSTERLDFATERAVIAVLDPKWRESSKAMETVRLDVRGGWAVCDQARLTAVGGADISAATEETVHRDAATWAAPESAQSVSVNINSEEGCQHASALLSCRVPLNPSHSESMWRHSSWNEIDLLHQGNTTFANLAWMTERIPMLRAISQWTRLTAVEVSLILI